MPVVGDLAQIAATLRQAGLDVVFIGGIVIPLYLGPEGRARARATEDIDLVVAAHSFAAWTRTEVTLRRLGFTNDVRDDAPICRFLFEGLTLDVIPVAPQFLGMDAAHLQAVMDRAQMYRTDRGTFSIPNVADLFAAKVAAFFSRGQADPFLSEDLEDLVALLDDCDALEVGLLTAGEAERVRVAQFLRWLAGHPHRHDLVDGNVVGQGAARAARARRLWLRVAALTEQLHPVIP